jgi:Iap family predicted aminopeptidase
MKRIVAAHYDAVLDSPGANDNAAACLSLILAARDGLSPDSMVCFFDFEEPDNRRIGQRPGSTIFSEQLDRQPELIVNCDVCGIGDAIVVSSSPCPQDQLERLEALVGYSIPVVSTPPADHYWMSLCGIESLLISTLPSNEIDDRYHPHWLYLHTPNDAPDTVEIEAIELTAEAVRRIIQ